MADMSDDLITIAIDPRVSPSGLTSEPSADLKVFPQSVQPELMQLTHDAGLNPKQVLGGQSSDTLGVRWEIISLTVTNAAFWTALAATIRTLITRHRGKKIVLREGTESVEITGYSPAELETLLQTMNKPRPINLEADNQDPPVESSD